MENEALYVRSYMIFFWCRWSQIKELQILCKDDLDKIWWSFLNRPFTFLILRNMLIIFSWISSLVSKNILKSFWVIDRAIVFSLYIKGDELILEFCKKKILFESDFLHLFYSNHHLRFLLTNPYLVLLRKGMCLRQTIEDLRLSFQISCLSILRKVMV